MNKGFSLIELLIVILIVSVVYFVGFEGFDLGDSKPKALTPQNLKTQIKRSELFKDEATLMCLDKCQTCYLRSGISSPFEAYPDDINLQNIKAYTLDSDDLLVPIEYGRYNDKKICLMMDFYKNGSSTQIILQNNKNTYFLSSFFETALTFKSPEDAKEYWINRSKDLGDSGAFY